MKKLNFIVACFFGLLALAQEKVLDVEVFNQHLENGKFYADIELIFIDEDGRKHKIGHSALVSEVKPVPENLRAKLNKVMVLKESAKEQHIFIVELDPADAKGNYALSFRVSQEWSRQVIERLEKTGQKEFVVETAIRLERTDSLQRVQVKEITTSSTPLEVDTIETD